LIEQYVYILKYNNNNTIIREGKKKYITTKVQVMFTIKTNTVQYILTSFYWSNDYLQTFDYVTMSERFWIPRHVVNGKSVKYIKHYHGKTNKYIWNVWNTITTVTIQYVPITACRCTDLKGLCLVRLMQEYWVIEFDFKIISHTAICPYLKDALVFYDLFRYYM